MTFSTASSAFLRDRLVIVVVVAPPLSRVVFVFCFMCTVRNPVTFLIQQLAIGHFRIANTSNLNFLKLLR